MVQYQEHENVSARLQRLMTVAQPADWPGPPATRRPKPSSTIKYSPAVRPPASHAHPWSTRRQNQPLPEPGLPGQLRRQSGYPVSTATLTTTFRAADRCGGRCATAAARGTELEPFEPMPVAVNHEWLRRMEENRL